MIQSKYPKCREAINALQEALKQKNNEDVEKSIQQLFVAHDEEMANGTSDSEGIFLQFKGIACSIEYHLYEMDIVSAIFYFDEMKEMFNEVQEKAFLSDHELSTIRGILIKTSRSINYFINDQLEINKKQNNAYCKKKLKKSISSKDNLPLMTSAISKKTCILCSINEANCTGSHLAPHFLIQPFLSYDGSNKRDTEVVNETRVAGFQKERKWGRAVLPEDIDKIFGYIPEEEKESIHNASLTRDYLFCSQCEKRFGIIESEYAKYYRKNLPCSNGHLAYVFWLGVFWRLSKADMAIKLNPIDETKIGVILQRLMPIDNQHVDSLSEEVSGNEYWYSIRYCVDTKGELSGIIGIHKPTSPYLLLIGNYVIELYNQRSQIPPGIIINDYTKSEQWQKISFIEYWKLKQKILDENYKYEFKHIYERKNKSIDIIKGDYFEGMPAIFGDDCHELKEEEIGEKKMYSLKIPGSIIKIIQLIENHPEADTQEKLDELIQKELRYSREEVQEMINYWNEHQTILTIPKRKNIRIKHRKQSKNRRRR